MVEGFPPGLIRQARWWKKLPPEKGTANVEGFPLPSIGTLNLVSFWQQWLRERPGHPLCVMVIARPASNQED